MTAAVGNAYVDRNVPAFYTKLMSYHFWGLLDDCSSGHYVVYRNVQVPAFYTKLMSYHFGGLPDDCSSGQHLTS